VLFHNGLSIKTIIIFILKIELFDVKTSMMLSKSETESNEWNVSDILYSVGETHCAVNESIS